MGKDVWDSACTVCWATPRSRCRGRRAAAVVSAALNFRFLGMLGEERGDGCVRMYSVWQQAAFVPCTWRHGDESTGSTLVLHRWF